MSHFRAFDVCVCGDYRHQHPSNGYVLCRTVPSPWARNCLQFNLDITATRRLNAARRAREEDLAAYRKKYGVAS